MNAPQFDHVLAGSFAEARGKDRTNAIIRQWNRLEAQQNENRRLLGIAVARNLPGIRSLVERRMAKVRTAQEALFQAGGTS